jgi:hypothetical protein
MSEIVKHKGLKLMKTITLRRRKRVGRNKREYLKKLGCRETILKAGRMYGQRKRKKILIALPRCFQPLFVLSSA